jgi:hypothetical protein
MTWAPRLCTAGAAAEYSASPTTPPRGWMNARLHSSAWAPPGPSPNVPAASASVRAANRHSAPDANGRLLGRNGRRTTIAPPAISAAGTT